MTFGLARVIVVLSLVVFCTSVALLCLLWRDEHKR